jgi:hypothetical protein
MKRGEVTSTFTLGQDPQHLVIKTTQECSAKTIIKSTKSASLFSDDC